MRYIILPQCIENIKRFYQNVAKKYSSTYSLELMHKNINETIDSMYLIENELLRRTPTKSIWKNCFMANTKKWYFAYKLFDDTVVIVDACHAQNMS